ncbi:MAG TPA: acyl transferase [Flavobacteriales bacterium]|nr:acyl transferase [Flavobacteriales bacterium]
MAVFRYQSIWNPVYRAWIKALKINPEEITHPNDIPYLPIQFFKDQRVFNSQTTSVLEFSSSGTTGMTTSIHHVADTLLYEESFTAGFIREYGSPSDSVILGLLPAYLERPGSSLVYMTEGLIRQSGRAESGFYLNNLSELLDVLKRMASQNQRVWLIGVSFALLDLALLAPPVWRELTVVETGGMKGRRKEMIREELHSTIRETWPVAHLHSEYGMTELFSQAWMNDSGRFHCPPWMDIHIRDANDPFTYVEAGKSGGINVIDLANLDSCSFIATQDLGVKGKDGTFDVIGRFDTSDLRGCNLLVS